MESGKYPTLQAYMEGTETTARALLARLRRETGHVLSEAMLSYILRGSRRCSRYHATALHVVTGVPFDALTTWPRLPSLDKSDKPLGKRRRSTHEIPNEKHNVG